MGKETPSQKELKAQVLGMVRKERSKADKALLSMAIGGFISLAAGAAFSLGADSDGFPAIHDFIAVSASFFTVAGFTAAYFQLKTIRELRDTTDLEVKTATHATAIRYEVEKASRLLEMIRSCKNAMQEKQYPTAALLLDYIITDLEVLRDNRLITSNLRSIIPEASRKCTIFNEYLRIVSRDQKMPDEEIQETFGTFLTSYPMAWLQNYKAKLNATS